MLVDDLREEVRTEILSLSRILQQFGPQLGRPRLDTLNGSSFANMKEPRFDAADGAWRVAFAFDTQRKAILLVAGDKSGVGEKRFYRELIRMGGNLSLVAKFPDRAPVVLAGIAEAENPPQKRSGRRNARAHS